MAFCQNCGREYAEGERYCRGCGQNLNMPGFQIELPEVEPVPEVTPVPEVELLLDVQPVAEEAPQQQGAPQQASSVMPEAAPWQVTPQRSTSDMWNEPPKPQPTAPVKQPLPERPRKTEPTPQTTQQLNPVQQGFNVFRVPEHKDMYPDGRPKITGRRVLILAVLLVFWFASIILGILQSRDQQKEPAVSGEEYTEPSGSHTEAAEIVAKEDTNEEPEEELPVITSSFTDMDTLMEEAYSRLEGIEERYQVDEGSLIIPHGIRPPRTPDTGSASYFFPEEYDSGLSILSVQCRPVYVSDMGKQDYDYVKAYFMDYRNLTEENMIDSGEIISDRGYKIYWFSTLNSAIKTPHREDFYLINGRYRFMQIKADYSDLDASPAPAMALALSYTWDDESNVYFATNPKAHDETSKKMRQEGRTDFGFGSVVLPEGWDIHLSYNRIEAENTASGTYPEPAYLYVTNYYRSIINVEDFTEATVTDALSDRVKRMAINEIKDFKQTKMTTQDGIPVYAFTFNDGDKRIRKEFFLFYKDRYDRVVQIEAVYKGTELYHDDTIAEEVVKSLRWE